MPTGFDIIGQNQALKDHWIKRVVAAIIDWIIIALPLWFIFNFVFWTFWFWGGWWFLWIFIWLLFFGYFVVMEGFMGGASLGKMIMGLKVVSTQGGAASLNGVVLRNASKIIGLVWLDALLGLFTEGDPRQKYSDRMGQVTVTRTDAQAYMEEQFRMMAFTPSVPAAPAYSPAPGPYQPYAQPAPGQQPAYQQQPYQAPPQQPAQPGWPGQQQPAPGGGWPQHQPGGAAPAAAPQFCRNCGGTLTARSDGRWVCVRCGSVF